MNSNVKWDFQEIPLETTLCQRKDGIQFKEDCVPTDRSNRYFAYYLHYVKIQQFNQRRWKLDKLPDKLIENIIVFLSFRLIYYVSLWIFEHWICTKSLFLPLCYRCKHEVKYIHMSLRSIEKLNKRIWTAWARPII